MLIEHSYRLRWQFGLRLTFAVTAAVFVFAVFLRLEIVNQLNDQMRGYEADVRRLNVQLDGRLTAAAKNEDAARAALTDQLKQLADSQAQLREDTWKSPFKIEEIVGSIVELICLDNATNRKYYTGSGVIVDPSGLVLTNEHVLTSGDGTLIRFCGIGLTEQIAQPPKIDLIGGAVATSHDDDLALLKISEHTDGSPVNRPFAALDLKDAAALARGLRLGDPVYIGGYPSVGADTLTMTEGVVAGRVGEHVVKTSAFIDAGASGGAVFDSQGHYVGVPTAAARGEIGGSLGYIIGADTVEQFLDDYRAGKNLVPPLPAARRK